MADTKIRVSMILDSKDFAEGMKAAGVSVEDFGKKTEKANEETKGFSAWLAGGVAGLVSSLTSKIMELGQALLSGIAEGCKQAVEAFIGFERAMRNVNSIAQESEEQFGKTSQAVLDLAVELGKSPTGLADALFDINSAGVSGAKGLDMVKQSAKLAEAGLTDTKTAAGGLLTAMQLYGEELGNSANAADKFSKANEIGRTTIGELSKEFGRVATTAKTAGVSFNETMAALAALTLAGQETNLAATNLNAAFTEIIKPSETLDTTFKAITGSTIQAYTAQNGMIGTLKALNDITGGSTEQMGKLGLSQSALAAIAGLAANDFKTFGNAIDQVGNSAGTLDKQLAQQQMTLSKCIERWEALKEVILVQIGEKLAPILAQIIDIAMKMGEAVNAWLANKDNIKKLNELIDAARMAVLLLLDALRDLAKTFVDAFSTGQKGATDTTRMIDTLIGVIKLAAGAVYVLIEAMKPLLEIVGDLGRILGAVAKGEWVEAFKASIEATKDTMLLLPKQAMATGKAMMDVASQVKDHEAAMNEEKTKKNQEEADKRVKAEQAAGAAVVESQRNTSNELQKFQAIDVEAFKEAMKKKSSAHASAMDTQTKNQADASAKQLESVTDMVTKADGKYQWMVEKDREVKIKTKVNGLDQLEIFDKLKDDKLILEMDWDKLNAFLLATVHKDYAVMIDYLWAIKQNTKLTADKIPEKASTF